MDTHHVIAVGGLVTILMTVDSKRPNVTTTREWVTFNRYVRLAKVCQRCNSSQCTKGHIQCIDDHSDNITSDVSGEQGDEDDDFIIGNLNTIDKSFEKIYVQSHTKIIWSLVRYK